MKTRFLLVMLFFTSCAKVDDGLHETKDKTATISGGIGLDQIIKVDDKTQDLSVAVKDYTNNTGITITVIPMVHIAEKEFYQYVTKKMINQVVVYEYFGSTFHDSLEIQRRSKALPPPYPNRAQFTETFPYDYWAEAYGLEKQSTAIDYRVSKVAVHADTEAPIIKKVLEGGEDILKKFIDFVVGAKLATYSITETDVDKKIELVRDFEKSRVTTLKEFMEPKNLSVTSDEHLKTDFYKNTVASRNGIVKATISDLLKRTAHPRHFVIVYGYLHMVEIEEFLVNRGFQKIDASVEWVKVFNLKRQKISHEINGVSTHVFHKTSREFPFMHF